MPTKPVSVKCEYCGHVHRVYSATGGLIGCPCGVVIAIWLSVDAGQAAVDRRTVCIGRWENERWLEV